LIDEVISFLIHLTGLIVHVQNSHHIDFCSRDWWMISNISMIMCCVNSSIQWTPLMKILKSLKSFTFNVKGVANHSIAIWPSSFFAFLCFSWIENSWWGYCAMISLDYRSEVNFLS
jgi:hypothetical protein